MDAKKRESPRRRLTVCFDLDGVLAEYDEIWRGYAHFGKPLKENIALVKRLHAEGALLILCTMRLSARPYAHDPQLIEEEVIDGTSRWHLERWLNENGVRHCFAKVCAEKPLADYYIDDRALRYAREGDEHGGRTSAQLRKALAKVGGSKK